VLNDILKSIQAVNQQQRWWFQPHRACRLHPESERRHESWSAVVEGKKPPPPKKCLSQRHDVSGEIEQLPPRVVVSEKTAPPLRRERRN
jgi:hypothetical protein